MNARLCLLLMPALLVLQACGGGTSGEAIERPAQGATFEIDFEALPDGLPPENFGEGRAIQYAAPEGDADAALRVVDGLLTNVPRSTDGLAGYYTSSNLGATISEVGANWSFLPRGDGADGAMAMIVSKSGTGPPLAVHLVITPDQWWYGIWPPGGQLDVIAGGRFGSRLSVDAETRYSATVLISGERAQVSLPDGTFEVIKNSRIDDWVGPHATFEVFSENGVDDPGVGFSKIWATTRAQ